ncbi:solute carrier organic anion transporter family member 4A1-like isoform X2 [Eriocheir sinensis]|uniref:solute carrier organic anion transporter family member 4A1-like isoform X2 n=1 Tax=Eriocheir sinensis TaxID=95602 RepID=UPI0021C603D6|nr:solute carrier organic anion transporter family member 4A1-like isoform X2 [Eriocheir sinensis]XP_050730183.1 solute carrier organic anion transporter family member 4A1-like isoform X2 [Eriocheir sinensis]
MGEVTLDPASLASSYSDSGFSSSQASISSDLDGSAAGLGSSRADLVAAEAEEEAGSCGWLCLRPRWLQHARTSKWVLFWLCWAAAAQGMVVNGFVNVCITTIEKRFNLRSTDAGLIAGAYDFAFLLCSMPVSYLGSRAGSCKPRWLGWGIFIMGAGSFLFALPHFLVPSYIPSSSNASSILYCLRQGTRENQCGVLVENWLSSYRHIFVLGQFLHGVGASPLYTLGITYLDESVPVKMSSVYLGIFYAMAVVGPAAGYVLGGQFLRVYINAPKVLPDRYGLEASSDLWLGGWWIGFLLSGSLCMLISWPIMAFPAQLPGAKAIKASRVSEAYGSTAGAGGGGGGGGGGGRDITAAGAGGGGAAGFGKLRDLPKAVKVLALNPTFLALSLAGATEGILLAGFATFTPKFLENQFSMAASLAALIVGFVVVPAGGGGTLLGGWIIKRLHLSCSGILKMCIIFSVVCVLSCLTFVISCPNIDFAGVNVEYGNRSTSPSAPSLIASCNQQCGCQDVAYSPVCGANNVMYFSPCHAGCSSMVEGQDGVKVFQECRCVAPSSPTAPPGDPRLAPDSALREKCPATCLLMPVFLAIFFVTMLLTFIISLPALSGTLRCVPDSHRSFALGLQWIVIRLLGTIPGPILFGVLFDHTCILWQSTCGRGGACRSYDNFHMSRYMMAVSVLFKFLSTILFIIAWWMYKAPPTSSDALPDPPLTLPIPHSSPATTPPITPKRKGFRGGRELRGVDNMGAELT